MLECAPKEEEEKIELIHKPECDEEEEQVEECSKNLLLLGKRRIPQSMNEIESFCK